MHVPTLGTAKTYKIVPGTYDSGTQNRKRSVTLNKQRPVAVFSRNMANSANKSNEHLQMATPEKINCTTQEEIVEYTAFEENKLHDSRV